MRRLYQIKLLIMSGEKLLFRVPNEKGHAHFFDSIAAFPGLDAGPSFEQREKYIRDMIRYQLMSTSREQAARSTSPSLSCDSPRVLPSPKTQLGRVLSATKAPRHHCERSSRRTWSAKVILATSKDSPPIQ